MNTSEISLILKKCTEILELFGDIPLTDALEKLYDIAQISVLGVEEQKKEKKDISDVDIICTINDGLIERMSKMDSNELSAFLRDSDTFKSKAALLYLAEKLSITSSKRHNIETLNHFIVTYFERGRMNDIIKNKRNNE